VTRAAGVMAAGDPRSRSTWSGTPWELVRAMELAGVAVSTASGVSESGFSRAASRVALLRYGRAGRGWSSYVGPRKHLGYRTHSALRAHLGRSTPILHTDTAWLNPAEIGPRDYLFRDVTWTDHAANFQIARPLAERIDRRHVDIYSSVKHIFVTSTWCKRRLEEAYFVPPKHISVVGTGTGFSPLPLDRLLGRDYSSGKTLCIAKVRLKQKGLQELIAGFHIAREGNNNLTLDIVAPESANIPTIDGVRLRSSLSFKELSSAYESAALYAMPARYEPWGLVYLEAQLFGTPIMGANRCAFPELSQFGENGFGLDSITAETVAKCLLDAHGNPAGLRAQGHRGHAYASEFSWRRTVDMILSVMFALP